MTDVVDITTTPIITTIMTRIIKPENGITEACNALTSPGATGEAIAPLPDLITTAVRHDMTGVITTGIHTLSPW
ncbi:hypothetical protein GCM10008094_00300 [Aidingimonas halophila]|nr:hypothetical protein GCM10008094_00300 [Aidingimonas halophila]